MICIVSITRDGVYANGGSSNFLIVQGQQNNNIPVDFYSCDIGVEFNNIMPTVTNCNMNDIFQYGVLGHRAFGLLTVNANNINSFNHGVFINDVTQVQGAFIDANSIILNVLIGAPSNGEAIHLAALALNNNYMEIAENDIVMHNGVAGIRCIGISSNVNNNGTMYVHHIHKNGISMDHTLKSSIGIDIVKCEAIRVTCNNIISTILGPTLFHQGINMTACPTAQIGCNKMTNTYYGLAVHGSNSGSLIRENHFRNHQTGLLYDANVTVGQQLFAGNTWAVPSVLDALNINSAFLNEYYYNGIGTLYEPITVIPPLGWFIQQQGIDPSDCPEDTLVNLPFVCPSFITGDTIDLEFAEKIATNQYVTSEFQEGILE
ncbi:MAG: hypothetical protein IPO27_00675 [Bacteroidetes bacterium]|nr:hypothetical protein [Bacteroidota bacterium]